MESQDAKNSESDQATAETEASTDAATQTLTETFDEAFNDASLPYEGRWNRLISTTNWEKGQIIFEWRSALKSAGAPSTDYSDEAWAQRVGSVTGQHIGRLRRVYERFGETHDQYQGLYWSHFQAALDWDDAEMWLEGGIQKQWSVAKMRKERWEKLGAPAELKPKDEDIISMEINEDLDAREDVLPSITESTIEGFSGPTAEGPDFGDDDETAGSSGSGGDNNHGAEKFADDGPGVPLVKPFENLADLPEDMSDAFESFKLSIIRHKTADWQEISREDTLGTLEALKELVMAPSAEAGSP